MKYTLKQSLLDHENKKKPRNLLNEVSHYKALYHAFAFYSVSSTVLFLIFVAVN